jgi:hypothetical protein
VAGTLPRPGTPIPPSAAAGDDGTADPRLAAALAAADDEAIIAALPGARLLVAVVAMPGEQQASEGEMALALLESASGSRALPAFSSVAALSAWQPDARPVPRPAAAVMAHAQAEGLAALVIDPAGPSAWTLPGDAIARVLDGGPPPDGAAASPDPADAVVSPPSWRPGRRLRAELAGVDAWALDVGGEPVVAVVLPPGDDPGDLAHRVAQAASRSVDLLVLDAERGRVVDAIGRRLGTAPS